MKKSRALFLVALALLPSLALAQKYVAADGKLRIALAKQPFAPNRQSPPQRARRWECCPER